MGLISSIGSSISNAIKKVTKVVKSFAPGGTTPSQAISSAFGGGGSSSKTSSSSSKSSGGGSSQGMSIKSPFDAPDNALTRKLAGQPQGTSTRQEPQLLGAGGTASGLLNIGTPVSIKSPADFVKSYWENIKTSSNTDALALAMGVTGIAKGIFGGILGGGTGATTQATATGSAQQIGTQGLKIGTEGVLPELTGTQGVGVLQAIKHLATWQTAIKTAVGISSVDVLVTWFGADNRASTSSYYTNLVRDRFNRGDVTRAEAVGRLNQLEQSHKEAKTFIDYSTMLNPVLWAFRGFFMDGMTEQEQNMADNRNFVMNTQETQSQQFLRTAEEKQIQFLENQKLILEAQLDAEARFEDAVRERSEDKQKEAKETAQFYEALRKRNAGEELTADEIDLLLRWGVSPEISMADWDAYGQSSLNFGLI